MTTAPGPGDLVDWGYAVLTEHYASSAIKYPGEINRTEAVLRVLEEGQMWVARTLLDLIRTQRCGGNDAYCMDAFFNKVLDLYRVTIPTILHRLGVGTGNILATQLVESCRLFTAVVYTILVQAQPEGRKKSPQGPLGETENFENYIWPALEDFFGVPELGKVHTPLSHISFLPAKHTLERLTQAWHGHNTALAVYLSRTTSISLVMGLQTEEFGKVSYHIHKTILIGLQKIRGGSC